MSRINLSLASYYENVEERSLGCGEDCCSIHINLQEIIVMRNNPQLIFADKFGYCS
jgi:hypothetical protein